MVLPGTRIRLYSWQELCQSCRFIPHFSEPRLDCGQLQSMRLGDIRCPGLAAGDEARADNQMATPSGSPVAVRGHGALCYRMEPGKGTAVDQEEVLQLLLDAPGGSGVVAPGAHVRITRVARGAVDLREEVSVTAENHWRYGD
jgi:hypothetical protein